MHVLAAAAVSPWNAVTVTTAIIASAGLFIALGSLAISGATFWRNRAPRPRWETGVKVEVQSDEKYHVTGSVENRGRGAALDVKFEPEGGVMRLFAQRREERMEYGKKLDITLIYGLDTSGTGKFVLTWYQEPHVHRKRTKVLKYKLKAQEPAVALPEPALPSED